MGPCVVCFYVNYGEDVVMAFKCKSVNISFFHSNVLGGLGRAGDCFSLGVLEIVVGSPSLGCGDSPMTSLPCLVTVMTLYWFWMCHHKKSLWSTSGMNFLSLLHFFIRGVSWTEVW